MWCGFPKFGWVLAVDGPLWEVLTLEKVLDVPSARPKWGDWRSGSEGS